MKIEDNLLEQNVFDKLQTFMMSSDIAWFFNSFVTYDPVIYETKEEKDFQFIHIFYNQDSPTSPFCEKLNPIFEKMKATSMWRIKANLRTRISKNIENEFHCDMGHISEEKQKQWTTSIFYINTNNGYTEFEDGTKVESVANRMITFPTNLKHRGTSCTDEKLRVVINFNYFR